MSKIKLTGESSGYVEISAGNAAGNNTLEAPTSGTRLVAHEGTQDVVLGGNLTVNGVLTYEDVTNIDSVGVITARNGINVTGGNVTMHSGGRIFIGAGGNAVDPMFAPVSDTNTGIAFPAADTMLFTTGGSERLRITSDGGVGIGTDDPNSRQLSVYGAGINGTQIECRATGGNSSGLSMYAGRNFEIQSTSSAEANYPNSFIVYDRDANGYRMAIDASGRVTKPSQPRFFAWSNTSNSGLGAGYRTVDIWNQTRFNVGNHFSTSTNVFTAPIAGCYAFGTQVRFDGADVGYFRLILSINNSTADNEQAHSITDSGSTGNQYHSMAITALYELSAGDNVRVMAEGNSDSSWTLQSESQFWGYLVA